MAASVASSSDYDDQVVTCSGKFDVFLSFRGEDTRNNFISHLYAALCRKKIKVYMDEYSLEKGDQISPALLKAIQDSKLSLIIFSKDYASSTWCLDELVCILKSNNNEQRNQSIIPVFYGLDPSCVRKQLETYDAAFVAHEQRFHHKLEKVKEWRDALTLAANISGFDSRQEPSESKLVDKIVECVLKKLNHISSRTISTSEYSFKNLVGIYKPVKEVEKLLSMDSSNVIILGIWGMGGIGKTTLASVLFSSLIHQFESGCFLANVKEESRKQGLVNLRKKLVAELLEEDYGQTLSTAPFCLTPTFAKMRFRRKKVLLVIDDVDSSEQVECLIGDGDVQFGVGSKILITSRDRQVLGKRANVIYTLEGLDFNESLQLFHLNAFKSISFSKTSSYKIDHEQLSEWAVSYTKGNPLALKVLGSFLHSRTKEEWENAFNKLKKVPHPDIMKVLRISYDDGLDDMEKDIFLDIACFFKGENLNFVQGILDACGFFPTIGIKVLIDKSLITINDKDEIQMHDLVQEVGREIVREESAKDPGKRSRLWNAQDVCHVLKNKRETEAVEGMYLDVSKLDDEEIHLKPKAFKKMWNMRLLKIYNSIDNKSCKVHAREGYFQSFPSSLRYLSWCKYPSKSLPLKFEPRNLVELNMPFSSLTELWNGVQNLGNLRRLNLAFSKQLIKVPDLSMAPKLESISVSYCSSLLELPPLNFQLLNENECYNGCQFSSRHNGTLDLSGCTKLKTLPKILGNVTCLNLISTAIKELPSTISSLQNLISFSLTGSLFLEHLPEFPRNIQFLRLGRLGIEQVPSSVGCLHHLKKFHLFKCKKLKTLPASIFKLKSLKTLNLEECSSLKNFSHEGMDKVVLTKASLIDNKSGLHLLFLDRCPNLEFNPYNQFYINLSCLRSFLLDGCLKVKHFQTSLLCMYSLTKLCLRCCNIQEIPDWLGLLSSLTELHLGGNPFQSIPSTIKQLHQLTTLVLKNCANLQSMPQLPFSIRNLIANGCTSLETISDIAGLPKLRSQMQGDVHTCLFCNCLKLNQHACNNFNDLLYAVPLMKGYPVVVVYCPGNNISDWFNHQSEGSSITIKLPPIKWLRNSFIGFATCFVFATEAVVYSPDQWFTIEGDLHLKTINGESLEKVDSFIRWNFSTDDFVVDDMVKEGSQIVISDHVFFHSKKFEAEALEKMFNSYFGGIEASFCFRVVKDNWDSGQVVFEVRRCGVRLLYSKEQRELSVIGSEFGVDTNYSRPVCRGKASSTSHAIIDFDTDQPHLKRCRRV